MQRLREMLARGGIALLAVVFALAFATFELADSVSEAAVAALQQHIVDPESGGSGFDFRIAATDFDLYVVVRATTALFLIAALLFVVWRLTRRESTECPDCRSEIPLSASVCRYCTADLPVPPT